MGVYCAALVACMSAVQPLSIYLSLSLSFLAPSSCRWSRYQSEHVWLFSSTLHTSSSPLPSGLTHEPLFFHTFPNNTRPLIQSHVVSSLSLPPTAAHLAAGSLSREQNSRDRSFLTISAMFSFRPSHLNKAFH